MNQSLKAFLVAHGYLELSPGYWVNRGTGWAYSDSVLGVAGDCQGLIPSRFYTLNDEVTPQQIFKVG